MTTPRGRLRLRSILTFYNAGLRQRSLHGRSGLLSGWRGILFSHYCAWFIPFPGQDRGFPAQYTTGCQPSTTTKLHVLLWKDFHLQARPDHCHSWAPSMLAMSTSPASAGASSSASVATGSPAAAAAAGSVLPSATGACDTTSVMVGAGLRLLSASSPTVSQSPSSPCFTRSEGGISCKQWNFVISVHNIEKQVLDYPTRGVYLLGCGLSDLELLGHVLACHLARPPWQHRQTSLQASQRILDERDVGPSRVAESRPQLEPLLKRFLVIFI
jgi:hypothetical protein